MVGFLRALALLAGLGLVGCATLPPPAPARTMVVLLPDEDGSVGEVSVRTRAGVQTLDRAFSATTADSAATPPSAAVDLERERVQADYRALLDAQPHPPASFVLHFVLDTAVLTPASKASIPALLDAVRLRKPTEITLYGHADASGTEARNLELSAERARFVAELLRRHDPSLQKIEVQAFGDKLPLVPSKPRAPEPRNRRVEAVIL